MPLSFPTSPTSGQTYQSGSSATYQYNGTYWTVVVPQSQIVLTSISASYVATASQAISSSFVATASQAISSSRATTSSFASTASFVNILNQDLTVTGILRSTQSIADEGGEIFLAKSITNTSLSQGVTLDVFQNRLRMFEAGSPNRGGYFDISTLDSGAGTNFSISEQSKNWIVQAYSTASYTLPSGYTQDPCRYNVINLLVNASASWFNTTTWTFTPLKAGYWEITAYYDIYRGSTVESNIAILRNGFQASAAGSIGAINITTTKIVYLNGSTDNIQITNNGAGASARTQSSGNSMFQARWLGT